MSSDSLHPADLDQETRHELGRLRIQHDKTVNSLFRQQRALGREPFEIAEDPEIAYGLNAIDAIIATLEPEA